MAESSSSSVPVPIYFIDEETISVNHDDKDSSVGGTYCDDNIGDGLHMSPERDTTFIEKGIEIVGSNKWKCVGTDAAIILTCCDRMLWNIGCSVQVITSAEHFPEITIQCSDSEVEEKHKRWNIIMLSASEVKKKVVNLNLEEENQLQIALSKHKQFNELKFYWRKPEKCVYIFGHSDAELENTSSRFHALLSERGQLKKSGREFARSFEEDSQPVPRKIRSFKTPSDAFEFQTEAGLNVKVYLADITKLNVDVIVNAANKELQHAGGVARAIALEAGRQLERECNDYVKIKGHLNVGENMVTAGGNLPSPWVIHALGPIWHNYTDKARCLEDLYKAVKGILKTCKDKKLLTVAMPAISGGVYGVPKDKCSQVYMKAVKDHSDAHGAIPRELHIVDINDDIIKYMQDAYSEFLRNRLDPFKVCTSRADMNNKRQAEGTRTDRYITRSASSSSSKSDSRTFPSVSNSDMLRWNTGLTELHKFGVTATSQVFMAVGDIVSAQVDCVVCACDYQLSRSGQIVKAVCGAGGRSFEKMYETVMTKNVLHAGEIFFVPGKSEKLKCDCVMFLVVDDDKYKRTVHRFIKCIFDEADKKQLSSIAMPIFRADALPETYKNEFVEAVLLEARKHSRPQSVYIVCREDDYKVRRLLREILENGDKQGYRRNSNRV